MKFFDVAVNHVFLGNFEFDDAFDELDVENHFREKFEKEDLIQVYQTN